MSYRSGRIPRATLGAWSASRANAPSVATPAISTGAFGFPIDRAARIALRTVGDLLPNLANLRTLRFVLFDDRALAVHREALAEVRAA